MAFTFKFNALSKTFDIVQDSSLLTLRGVVDTTNDLPLTGNTENDIFVVKAGDRLFTWNKATSSGILADWVDVGSVASIDWSIITNKPTSGVGDIDDAVTKKHTQNTDTILTTDGSVALLNTGTLKTNLLSDNAINIQIDEIRARDIDGLKLNDDSGNGIFIEDGGNIGIGTIIPSEKLEVAVTSDHSVIHINAETGSSNEARLIMTSGAKNTTFFYRESDNNFGFFHNGLTKFRVLSDGTILLNQGGGNVGIGVTDPDAKLEINGQIKITGGNPGNSKYLRSDADGLATWGDIGWTDLGTDVVLLNSGDNVGIGTATPDGKLEVRQTGTSDIFNLYDNTTNVFTVIDGGNVGIGIVNPVSKLDVGGEIASGNGTELLPSYSFNSSISTGMRYDSTTPALAFSLAGKDVLKLTSSGDNFLKIVTGEDGGGDEVIQLIADGTDTNIGITITGKSGSVNINNEVGDGGVFIGEDDTIQISNNGAITVGTQSMSPSNTSGNVMTLGASTSDGTRTRFIMRSPANSDDFTIGVNNVAVDGGSAFLDYIDGTEMRLKTSSGTAISISGLDVELANDFIVDSGLIFADASNGTVTIGNNVTGTDRFNVFGAGFADVQTGIAAFYNSAGNLKFRLRDELTSSSIPPRIEADSSLGLAFNTVSNAPFIWYVNGTGNEKMRLDSNGLGIGTTASEKLDVNGNIKLSGNLTDGTDSTTPAELRTHLDNLTKHRLIDDILSTTTNLYSASFIDSLFSASANNLDIKDSVETVADSNITLSGEQTINAVLTSGSRVGIIGQTLSEENGIYITSAGAWSRSTDADISAEVTNGLSFFVSNSGSTKNGNQYILITPDTITLDTTGLNFIEVPRIVLGTIGGTATEGDDSRIPTQDENDALIGTNGTPSTANKYVTNSDPRLTADIAITRKELFASTNARFFGELGIPNSQGWTDNATGSTTIDLVNETVFATIKQVVRHNDNFTNGSTSSFIVLTAQNWIDINAFGASYGGTSRLDTINGSSGFFSGLQADAVENPIDGNNRRYGITFDNNSGNLRVTEPDTGGTTVTFDGTGGNPQINFDTFVTWECVIPAGLGSAEFYINDVLTTFSPTFIVNTGGTGTRVTLSSGSTSGTNRITYHDNFGVTIYEESSTKTLSVLTMSADAMQVFIPEGKRDYTIILPDGNPRPFGSEFNILTGNLLGDITLTNQNVGSPQILYNGLRTLVLSVVTTQLITSINTVDNNNVYTGF